MLQPPSALIEEDRRLTVIPLSKAGQPEPGLCVRLAKDADDLIAAQRLRYQVFVRELGATGPMVDHAAQLERDAFDDAFEHLLLIDESRTVQGLDSVVGVYRVLTSDRMPLAGRYYSEDEFDLTALKTSGRKLVELGRSCVHPQYRGGPAMLLLWNGLADFVLERGIEVMFGAASFHGTDTAAVAQALSLLHHTHLAPIGLRVQAKGPQRRDMNLLATGLCDPLNGAGADAGLDPGLSAVGRLCGRRGVHRQRLQYD